MSPCSQPVLRSPVAFALCALVWLIVSRPALAQSLPASLRVNRHFALQSEAVHKPLPELVEIQKELRRARAMMVVGASLALSGVVHAIAFGRSKVCYEDRGRMKVPPIQGAALAVAGVTLTFAGRLRLLAVPASERARYPISPKRRAYMIAGALGVLAVSQATLIGTMFVEWIDCTAS